MLEGLLGDAFERRIIVESEVTGVDDVIRSGLLREIVERP